jgi:hypothetical protein
MGAAKMAAHFCKDVFDLAPHILDGRYGLEC